MLPKNKWAEISPLIQKAGEDGILLKKGLEDKIEFLRTLGLLTEEGDLSESGKAYFEAAFIRCDGCEEGILRQLLIQYPPTQALSQYLWGVKNVSVDQVVTVLKVAKFWHYENTSPLTHFLDLLNAVGIVNYSRKSRIVEVMIAPDTPLMPRNIFIDPSRPYSNILWIKRVLAECKGGILWLDKHFQKEAFEWLWAIADANKISDISILSLDMGEVNLNQSAKKEYNRFKSELANKGIRVEWRVIDSKLVRNTHDRWVADRTGYARNIPNIGAINSGQRSELSVTENYAEIFDAFNEYWVVALPVNS